MRRNNATLDIFMLEVIDLSKSYNGDVALSGLNLKIEPGKTFYFLGANGARKTTTINIFLNCFPAMARIDQLDAVRHSLGTKKYLAHLREQLVFCRNLTGIENLDYFTSLARERYSREQLPRLLKDDGCHRPSGGSLSASASGFGCQSRRS